MLAIEVAIFLPEKIAAVPAVAEDGTEPVGAGLKEFSDIGREDLNALPVVGPAGHKEVSSDFLAVEVELRDAEGGPMKGGAADGFQKEEGFPQKGAWLFPGGFPFPVSDPLGGLERHCFLDSRRRGAGNSHLVPKIRTKMPRGVD